ncbi:MAG: 50S ribosomal protein L21 [Candidatus Zixiibacteriota bacterium]
MTFAIIESGGSQRRVSVGDTIRVEKLPGSAGEKITIDKVLFVKKGAEALVGSPYVENATVEALISDEGLAEKILVFKKKRRTKYRRLRGHRQSFSELKIKKINIS